MIQKCDNYDFVSWTDRDDWRGGGDPNRAESDWRKRDPPSFSSMLLLFLLSFFFSACTLCVCFMVTSSVFERE